MLLLGMVKKKFFHVERHSDTQWRVVNQHIGHGLLFPTKKMAIRVATTMNLEMRLWIHRDMESNPFKER